MNIFERIMSAERKRDRSLGNPLPTWDERERRLNTMATMTGGKGFRTPPKGPKTSPGGKTRRELVAAGIRKPRYLKVRP